MWAGLCSSQSNLYANPLHIALSSCACNQASDDEPLRPIIRWAVQRPSLQRLLLGSRPLTGSMWPEIGAAGRLRPSLSILPSLLDHADFDF